MGRATSDCQTFSESEQEVPEPETEDFFEEVVQTSLKTKGKGHLREKRKP